MRKGNTAMELVKKIPLKERLQKVSTIKPNFLAIFEIHLEDYFIKLADIGTPPCISVTCTVMK